MKDHVNQRIRKQFKEVIYHIARYAEMLLSVVILVVIAMAAVPLVLQLTQMPMRTSDMDFFTNFLAQALSLVVGVEFVKMLCKHTAETVVEVLLFAIARQMVVEHYGTLEILLGVLSIAVLFAIRKFLLLKEDDTSPKLDKL